MSFRGGRGQACVVLENRSLNKEFCQRHVPCLACLSRAVGGRARLLTTAPHMEQLLLPWPPSPRGCRGWLRSLTPVPSSESLLLAAEMSGRLRPHASPLPFGGELPLWGKLCSGAPLGARPSCTSPQHLPAGSLRALPQ